MYVFIFFKIGKCELGHMHEQLCWLAFAFRIFQLTISWSKGVGGLKYIFSMIDAMWRRNCIQ